MELNDVYEKIVDLGGDCFKAQKRPPCQHCPFIKQCLHKMVTLAEHIPKQVRLEWALDKLVEEYLFDDNDGK